MKTKIQDHNKLLSTRNLLHQCQQQHQQPVQKLFSYKSQDKLEKISIRGD
jgi:hypothetical protein